MVRITSLKSCLKDSSLVFFKSFHMSLKVLIDPKKRAIYDSVGAKGLANNDLQLVVRSKSPKEIREEYERLSKEREERLQENLTRSEVNFGFT